MCQVIGDLSAEGVEFWDRKVLCGHRAEELSTHLEEGSIREVACKL